MITTDEGNGHPSPPRAAELGAIVVQNPSPIWCSICKRTIGEKPANTSMRSLLDASVDHFQTEAHHNLAKEAGFYND